MGKKVDAPSKEKSSTADNGVDDLSVLHPERRFVLAGRQLVMREYGFIEGLRLAPLLDPIISDVRTMLEQRLPMPDIEAYPVCLGNHADALVKLMAVAADVEPDWIVALKPDDGDELVWWWWLVNGPFCVRRALNRATLAVAAAEGRKRAGQTSTQTSSGQDMDPLPMSGE